MGYDLARLLPQAGSLVECAVQVAQEYLQPSDARRAPRKHYDLAAAMLRGVRVNKVRITVNDINHSFRHNSIVLSDNLLPPNKPGNHLASSITESHQSHQLLFKTI